MLVAFPNKSWVCIQAGLVKRGSGGVRRLLCRLAPDPVWRAFAVWNTGGHQCRGEECSGQAHNLMMDPEVTWVTSPHRLEPVSWSHPIRKWPGSAILQCTQKSSRQVEHLVNRTCDYLFDLGLLLRSKLKLYPRTERSSMLSFAEGKAQKDTFSGRWSANRRHRGAVFFPSSDKKSET